MKKKRILIIIAIIIIMIVTIVRSIVPSYSSVLEANWGFELPVRAMWNEVYEADTGASFHGDGTRYHVYSYRNEAVVESMLPWAYAEGTTLSWAQNEGEEKHYKTYSEEVSAWLSDLNVPTEFIPEFDAVAYWYDNQIDNSQIIIIWNSKAKRVYIAEMFI